LTIARKTVGFAVVGLGSIAQGAVLPAFAQCRDVRLVALVSRDRQKAARLARKFKTAAFYSVADYAACLANPEVAAVYVATPQGEHESFTIQAARAGKHVLCEKPLAATPQQSGRMVEACRKNRVLLMTAYRKYFEPSTVYLKRLIQSGKLGRIDTIHTGFSELYTPGVSTAWLLDRKLAGGGPLTDLGVYCVNTTRWLMGEDPVEATAEAWRHHKGRFREVEEGITFRLRFPSGLVVLGSSTYGAVLSSFIHVQGSKGWALLAPAYEFNEARQLNGKVGGRRVERRFRVIDEFAAELDAFASAIQGRGTVDPDGSQGHRDVIILHSIYEAAKLRKSVAIRYA
jgi:predicted dehydrogenase